VHTRVVVALPLPPHVPVRVPVQQRPVQAPEQPALVAQVVVERRSG